VRRFPSGGLSTSDARALDGRVDRSRYARMRRIETLDAGQRTGPDPATFNG
jgi:hypothetical protein